MKFQENKKMRDITRVLLFAPVVVFFFLSFSFFKKGLTEAAIIFGVMGIGLILLVFLLGITQRIIGNKRRFVLCCAILLILLGLYCLVTKDIYNGIAFTLFGVFLILATVFPEKHWQISISVVFVLALGVLNYLVHFRGGETDTDAVQQGSVNKTTSFSGAASVKAPALESRKYAFVDMMANSLTPTQRADPAFQKMLDIMNSDSFQQELKEQNPQTVKEFFRFLDSQGITGLEEIDIDKVLDDSFQDVKDSYTAARNGQPLSDEDDEMARQLAAAIDKSGHVKGLNNFMGKHGMWMGVRFHGDDAAFDTWFDQVRTKYEAGDFTTPTLPQTDSNLSRNDQEASPFNEDTPSLPFVETELTQGAKAPEEVWEDPLIPDTADRSLQLPAVKPEKVVTEVSPQPPALPTEAEFEATLRERFSKDRFDRAMDTLERYGEKEGLRHLQEDDPEVAEQIEQQRNREKLEKSER